MQTRTSVIASLVLGASLVSCGRSGRTQAEAERSRLETPRAAERSPNVQSYAMVVDRVSPSVLTIRSSRRVRQPRQFPFFNDPFFEEFFGRRFRGSPQAEERVQQGLGSGVIVRADGHCVTNHHVVDGAEDIRVEFADGTSFRAKIVGSDPPSDLAVLKFSGPDLKAIALANSDDVRVGDVVLAVGNPLGVGQTVTAGIISAKGRTTGLSDGSFEDFLQTDAPINRGNSGGALVNTAGELVGINSQILSPSGGNIGIGFAIPVNMMRDVMDQLIKRGHVRRGQLGVIVQPVTSQLADAMRLSSRSGVLVSDVQPAGPADRAGIRRGDLITRIGGEQIETTNELRNIVSAKDPGSDVKITVDREGKTLELSAKLAELKGREEAARDGSNGAAQRKTLGIAVQPMTPAVASQLGLPSTNGVVVRDVDPRGPGAEAGLRPGDVIVQVNRQPVRTVQELEQLVDKAGSQALVLLVNRRGRTFFVPVEAQ